MKTISVRDLRQRWPDAEKALALEKEILITRDGQPVAKLSQLSVQKKKRQRFDPAEHRRWKEKVFGKGTVVNWVAEFCEKNRAERF